MMKFKWKMSLKRVLCAALAGVLTFGMFGCGKSDNNSVSLEDDESKPYEIIWYYLGTSTFKDMKKVEAKVNEYLKDKINATVKMNPFEWGPYHEKIENVRSSGEKYDLVWLNINSYQTGVYKGAYMNIKDVFNKYAPKTKKLVGEKFLKACELDGGLYAIPANKDKAHYYSLLYRKDIADKYGMDLSGVKTFEDMFPFFDTIRDNEKGMYAYGMKGGATPWYIYSGMDIVGINESVGFLPEYGDEVKFFYETKEFKKLAETAKVMYDRGYVHKDCAVNDNTSTLMSQGKVFATIEIGKPGLVEEKKAQYNQDYAEVPLTEVIAQQSDIGGSMMAIPTTCENPVRVMKFIELLNTDKYLHNLVCFGIEGEHYEKVSENRIKLKKDSGYANAGNQWVYGNMFLNYLYDDESDTKYEELQKFNDSAKVSKYLGFIPNLESVRGKASACQNVVDEYAKVIEYGATDIDTKLPEFINKAKKAGIDDVVAEIQKQYNEWKKNK